MSLDPTDSDASQSSLHTAVTVIVFARAPIPGQAKTRLIPALGDRGAAALARRMLEHAVSVACEAALGPVNLCVTPDASHPVFDALQARHRLRVGVQGEGDIGTRMQQALEHALMRSRAALLVGTDLPQLDSATLRAAATALNDHDVVFVPVHDGGYGLVGLRRPQPALFRDIAWSTSHVMSTTRNRAAALGLSVAELPALADVDTVYDLTHVPQSWLPRHDTPPLRTL